MRSVLREIAFALLMFCGAFGSMALVQCGVNRTSRTPPAAPADSASIVGLRMAMLESAQAEAAGAGWRLVSGVGEFARLAAWWREDPFWTYEFPVIWLRPDLPDTVQCRTWTTKGKTATVCVPPGASLEYKFRDGDGANLGREYAVMLFNQMPGDLYFAKYHHGTNVIEVRKLDLERVQ